MHLKNGLSSHLLATNILEIPHKLISNIKYHYQIIGSGYFRQIKLCMSQLN
jgi:hypothetical protein